MEISAVPASGAGPADPFGISHLFQGNSSASVLPILQRENSASELQSHPPHSPMPSFSGSKALKSLLPSKMSRSPSQSVLSGTLGTNAFDSSDGRNHQISDIEELPSEYKQANDDPIAAGAEGKATIAQRRSLAKVRIFPQKFSLNFLWRGWWRWLWAIKLSPTEIAGLSSLPE